MQENQIIDNQAQHQKQYADDEDVYIMQFMTELKISSQLLRSECMIILASNQCHQQNKEAIMEEHQTTTSVEQEQKKPKQLKIAINSEEYNQPTLHQRKRESVEYKQNFSSMAAIGSKNAWKLGEVSLNSFQLKILFKKVHIQELDSIACSAEMIVNQKRSITLNICNGQKIMIGTETQQCSERLPLQFAWFAKIILSRLAYLGYSEKHSHQKEISTYLGYAEKGTAINVKKIYSKGLIYCQHSEQEWVECYAAINDEGLFIFESPQSFYCLIKQANRIFTDFRLYDEHLVMVIEGAQKQIWVGIPINAYNYNSANNWLLSFYRLLRNIDE